MLAIFETILPVFLLVVLGALLKRWRQIDRDMWNGLEQLGFFVLFPALLFITLAKAEFSGIDAGAIAAKENHCRAYDRCGPSSSAGGVSGCSSAPWGGSIVMALR